MTGCCVYYHSMGWQVNPPISTKQIHQPVVSGGWRVGHLRNSLGDTLKWSYGCVWKWGIPWYTGIPLNGYFSNDSNPMDLGIHEFQTNFFISSWESSSQVSLVSWSDSFSQNLMVFDKFPRRNSLDMMHPQRGPRGPFSESLDFGLTDLGWTLGKSVLPKDGGLQNHHGGTYKNHPAIKMSCCLVGIPVGIPWNPSGEPPWKGWILNNHWVLVWDF
jgi:hypothetical protein